VCGAHFFVGSSQMPLEQSPPTLQDWVSAHLLGQVPPQSVSVSVPFFTPSLHAGALHFFVFESQTPLWQSPEAAHALPSAHLLGQEPPQSVSVSVPFLIVSLHGGAASG